MQFSKMHGLGNDFMVVDAVTQNVFFSPELIRRLSDRHLGIGFDQLLIVEPPYDPDLDFHYRIFNADGSEVAQCGNGARCFARFVQLKGLTNKSDIRVSTQAGRMVLSVTPDDLVRVNMGEPNFEPQQVPFRANKAENLYLLRVAEQTVMFGAVSMGNPHCVIQVESTTTAQVELLGHAGITPQWDLDTAQRCAREVEAVLSSDSYPLFLDAMYGDMPNNWNDSLAGLARLRFSTNALTRMRFCFPNGQLDMICKDAPESAPPPLKPWFMIEGPVARDHTIVFGHWASLEGKGTPAGIIGLDTGCCWGGNLTLLHWETQRYYVQPSNRQLSLPDDLAPQQSAR